LKRSHCRKNNSKTLCISLKTMKNINYFLADLFQFHIVQQEHYAPLAPLSNKSKKKVMSEALCFWWNKNSNYYTSTMSILC
jgi:hypothetical protein